MRTGTTSTEGKEYTVLLRLRVETKGITTIKAKSPQEAQEKLERLFKIILDEEFDAEVDGVVWAPDSTTKFKVDSLYETPPRSKS